MWPALKAHHDTPTPGGLFPHQILFGKDPLGRGLPLSGDGMAMDAKEFFARQEATARDICQQLEKEHAERQKSAPSSTAQKFRVGGLATGRCGDTHKQAGRQSTALTGASLRSCHVTKRFRILATLKQGNKSMYSNTSGYVHMGLRLDWGKCITGQ